MGKRKLTQVELAKALDISPAAVTRCKQRGMPVHSIGAAEAWRATHLDPRLVAAARWSHRSEPPAKVTVTQLLDPDTIADLLEDAGEAIVANLVCDCDLTMQRASLAINVVASCISDVLEARGIKNDLWAVSGPTGGLIGAEEEVVRSRIDALVAAIRAQD